MSGVARVGPALLLPLLLLPLRCQQPFGAAHRLVGLRSGFQHFAAPGSKATTWTMQREASKRVVTGRAECKCRQHRGSEPAILTTHAQEGSAACCPPELSPAVQLARPDQVPTATAVISTMNRMATKPQRRKGGRSQPRGVPAGGCRDAQLSRASC